MRAALWLPALALGLRLLGFPRLLAALLRRYPLPAGQAPPDRLLARLGRTRYLAGLVAKHGLYRGNCLTQSLTLWLLLRQQGLAADLRIGVRKDGPRLEAHAWVEYLGRPLNDSPLVGQRYTPFDQPILPKLVRWS